MSGFNSSLMMEEEKSVCGCVVFKCVDTSGFYEVSLEGGRSRFEGGGRMELGKLQVTFQTFNCWYIIHVLLSHLNTVET